MRANKDIYTVEANQEDFLTLLEVAEKASVSLSTVFLPATIDILVHEYNSTHQEPPIEYKELLTDDRSIRENLKLISSYLKEIDVKDDLLVIVDNYIFPQRFDDSYANDLLDLIEGSGAIQVTIMTSSIINENLKENIKQELAKRVCPRICAISIPITVKSSRRGQGRTLIIVTGSGPNSVYGRSIS